MRKNIYNEDIMMIDAADYINILGSKFITLEEQRKLVVYCYDVFEGNTVAFYKDDEIVKIIEKYLHSYYYKHKKVELKSILNAYMHSVINNDEIAYTLISILKDRPSLSISEFIINYGIKVYEYIKTYQDYSYIDNKNEVLENDKEVFLFSQGIAKKVNLCENKKLTK